MYRFKLGSEFKLCGCAAFYHSKAVVLLLLIHYFIVVLDICGGYAFPSCLVMQYLVYFLDFYHLADEERARCFTLIVFLLLCS